MSRLVTKPTKWLCAQRRLRTAWASAQSDQGFRCLHEETLGPQLSTERIAKTLNSLGGCPGWSESSLGARVILLVPGTSSISRYISDQLDVLLRHIELDEEAYPLDRQTVENIRQIQKQAEVVSDKAAPYIESSDPEYYKRKSALAFHSTRKSAELSEKHLRVKLTSPFLSVLI